MAYDQIECEAIAGATMAAYTRVTMDSGGLLQVADADDPGVGVVNFRGAVETELTGFWLNNSPTLCVIASGVVAVGDPVFAAAAGKVTATPGVVLVGTAVTAAAEDGDVIRVLPGSVFKNTPA